MMVFTIIDLIRHMVFNKSMVEVPGNGIPAGPFGAEENIARLFQAAGIDPKTLPPVLQPLSTEERERALILAGSPFTAEVLQENGDEHKMTETAKGFMAEIGHYYNDDNLLRDTILTPLVINGVGSGVFHGCKQGQESVLTSTLFLIGYELGVPGNRIAGIRNIEALLPMIYRKFCLNPPLIGNIDLNDPTIQTAVATFFDHTLKVGLYFDDLVNNENNNGGKGDDDQGDDDKPPPGGETINEFLARLDLSNFGEREKVEIPQNIVPGTDK